jgi:prepilin-type N-terminal cleavage/methylation domain-containing protein
VRGFTLTELLVALALVGLATGLVVTQAHRLVPAFDRDRAAWQLVDVLAVCRRQAVADGDFYNVAVDLDLGRLKVSAYSDRTRAAEGATFRLPGDMRILSMQSGGAAATSGTVNITLTPTGVTTPFVLVLGDERPRLRVTSDGLSEEVVELAEAQ